ncbi:MAG: site-specific integrase [Eubacteriales bacterium]|nr:site-specific integrase [Eubacteriales bacterium]
MPVKLSSMTQRKDGRWQKNIVIGRRESGAYQRKTLYGRTKKEVNQKVSDLHVKLRMGTFAENDNMTFREMGELWLKNYKNVTSEDTQKRYERIMHKHLFPELGMQRLKNLKPLHLQSIINRCTAAGYAARTMSEIKHTASQILEAAVENDLLFRNVFAKVRIPKIPAETRRALTQEEQDFLYANWREHRMGLPALVMTYCGLRRGEMIALTWNDVDMTKREITVNKSANVSNNQPKVKSPKSQAGVRTVPIPDILYEALGAVQKTSLYVCPSAQGGMMTEAAYRCAWRSYMHFLNLRAGGRDATRAKPKVIVFPHITAHMLRHTYASLLYDAGVDVKSAQKFLGHASLEMTLGVYTHLSKLKEDKSIEALNTHLRGLGKQAEEVAQPGNVLVMER